MSFYVDERDGPAFRVELLAEEIDQGLHLFHEDVFRAVRAEADEVDIRHARALRPQRGKARFEQRRLGMKGRLVRDRDLALGGRRASGGRAIHKSCAVSPQ